MPSLKIDYFQSLESKITMPGGLAKFEDSKPRGKMTAYAFFVQTCREEYKKKHPDEQVDFAEFSKKCAERWKTMTDKEKKRFNQMAESDKRRFELEIQNLGQQGHSYDPSTLAQCTVL